MIKVPNIHICLRENILKLLLSKLGKKEITVDGEKYDGDVIKANKKNIKVKVEL